MLVVFSVFTFVVVALFGAKFVCKITHPLKYYSIVAEASQRYGVEKELIYAIIKCESDFDESAKSQADACGLMQITPETFEWLSLYAKNLPKDNIDFHDPSTNIMYGTLFLSMLQDKYQDGKVVISAYNAGPTAVDRWLGDEKLSKDGKTLDYIPYKETRHYAAKVKLTKSIYKILYF